LAATSPDSTLTALPGEPLPFPSLAQCLLAVPENRQSQGRRYTVHQVLLLLFLAVLADSNHYRGASEFGRTAAPDLRLRLGFTRGTPAPSTFYEVLAALDWEAFAAALRLWGEQMLAFLVPGPARTLSLDGKTLRASRKRGGAVCHLLSVFCHELGLTLEHAPVRGHDSELPGAEPLLARVNVAGHTVLMDALFTQEALALAITRHGGDYVLPVKGNQAALQKEIRLQFEEAQAAAVAVPQASSTDCGHGREEYRSLQVLTVSRAELDWGGARQIFRLERMTTPRNGIRSGKKTHTVTYGITSLPRARADAAKLLQLVRQHWGIETRSHYIRDVLFEEDRSQITHPVIVPVMAAIRTAALTLLRTMERRSISEARRHLQRCPKEAAGLLGIP
jgi:predicted transposase YbfD/YdcC